jgi:ADP-heptose:LPS heptosyltransferase
VASAPSVLQLPSFSAPRVSRVLLVRLRQIGDVVFTTPAIGALRRAFPRAHLAYLVEPLAAPVVAGHPSLDEVIVAPRKGLVADVALGRRLRRAGYDLAIDFHGGPRASLLTWLSGAPMRIGYDVNARGWMYTHRVARPRELRARHSVENQWDLLAPLGIAPPDPSGDPVVMAVDARAVHAVDTRLAAAGAEPDDVLIVVHVSAGNPFRRWPLDAFGALIARLVSGDARRRIVVTSGPSEAIAAAGVVADARRRIGVGGAARVLVCGEFSLAELRALDERAALFIGGDSGPLHIAATSPVPIVALYGPTLPARSAPWRRADLVAEALEVPGLPCRPCDQRRCEPGDFRCLGRIGVDTAAAAAERVLAQGSPGTAAAVGRTV